MTGWKLGAPPATLMDSSSCSERPAPRAGFPSCFWEESGGEPPEDAENLGFLQPEKNGKSLLYTVTFTISYNLFVIVYILLHINNIILYFWIFWGIRWGYYILPEIDKMDLSGSSNIMSEYAKTNIAWGFKHTLDPVKTRRKSPPPQIHKDPCCGDPSRWGLLFFLAVYGCAGILLLEVRSTTAKCHEKPELSIWR